MRGSDSDASGPSKPESSASYKTVPGLSGHTNSTTGALPLHSLADSSHRRSDDLSSNWEILHHGSKRRSNSLQMKAASLGGRVSAARRYVRDFVQANKGLLFICASQWFFALMNLGVKFLTGLQQPVPTFELIATRMGVTCACCIGWMMWQDVPYPITGPPEVRHLLAIRGVTGFFGLFGVYYSLQYLSLSDATAITFLSPSTIAVAGFLLLHEPLRMREIFAGLFALFGVLLIARPEAIFGKASVADPTVEKGTPGQRLGAVGVALLGVLGATGALITIRHIKTRAHPMHSISYFSAWCVIVACVGSVVLRVPWVLPRDPMWSLGLLAIGIAGFFGQVLLTMGLQIETAGRGSIGLYVQIIYTTILERIFFQNTPSILSIMGTVIIMGSAIYIALTKEGKVHEAHIPTSDQEDATPAGSPSHISRSLPMLPTSLVSDDNNYIPENMAPSGRISRHRSSPSGGRHYVSLPADAEPDTIFDADGDLDDDDGASEVTLHADDKLAPTTQAAGGGSLWSPLSPFSPKRG